MMTTSPSLLVGLLKALACRHPREAYLLLDPDSGELNAVEVPFFRDVLEGGRLAGEFWQLIAGWLQSGHTSVHIPPRWEDRVEDALRNLVSA